MTGFGQGATERPSLRVSARIRSVNHRFLDVVLRVPEEFRDFEASIREAVGSRLHRGRIEVRVEIDDSRDREVEVQLNRSLVSALGRANEELQEHDVPLRALCLRDLLRIPDAVRIRSRSPDQDRDLAEAVASAVATALDELTEARRAEGERLSVALRELLDGLAAQVTAISQRRQEIQQQLAQRLRERWEALTAEIAPLDETRLAQEMAFQLERSDVREELDRLQTHLEHFRDVLDRDGAIGKRLDFLAQEVFRELTTLASKGRQTDLVQRVIDAKLLCEQIREQAQNLE